MPEAARSASAWRPAKPLSVMRIRPGRAAASWGSTSSIAASTSRSPILGSASAHKMGIPAGVVIRYSRSPQNQREWLAQYPVVRPPGQVRALDRGPRAPAFHRGGVGEPDIVGPEVAVGGRVPDRLPD